MHPASVIALLVLLTPAGQGFLRAWRPALESAEMFQAKSQRAQECVLYSKKKKKIHWRQFRYLAPEAFFVSLNYL